MAHRREVPYVSLDDLSDSYDIDGGGHTEGEPMEKKATIKLATPTEVSAEFMQGMADRMAVSFHKYGAMASNYPFPGNALDSLRKRITKYEETGNTEWLMDVANFAMIEFMRPAHPEAHFRATDSRESPGVKVDGEGFVRDNLSRYKGDA